MDPPELSLARRLQLWERRWRWYERQGRPWRRLRLDWELMRRSAYARRPLHGNVLEALLEGRLEIGAHVMLEPHVWITAPGEARVGIGSGSFLNIAVMIAAKEEVSIGEHCMFANGCVITDADHRFDDPVMPVPWQGFTSKGPTRVGDNVWCGAHTVITSGVTIGERCVVGAGSVVTRDLPPRSVAVGAPARVVRQVPEGPVRLP